MPRYYNVNSSGALHSKHAQAASPPCGRATLAGRTIGEVSDPQSIRAIGLKVTLDQISGACRCAIWHSGTHPFATSDTLYTKATHQAFNRAARPRHAFPMQLLPDLANPIALEVLLPHTLHTHHA